jgi:hypothetical protein
LLQLEGLGGLDLLTMDLCGQIAQKTNKMAYQRRIKL